MVEAVQPDPPGQRIQAAPETVLTVPLVQVTQSEALSAFVPTNWVPGAHATLDAAPPSQ